MNEDERLTLVAEIVAASPEEAPALSRTQLAALRRFLRTVRERREEVTPVRGTLPGPGKPRERKEATG